MILRNLLIAFNLIRMDFGLFYMQNGIVYARRFSISIGEHIDGHINWTLYRDIMSLCYNYFKVSVDNWVLFFKKISSFVFIHFPIAVKLF